MVAESTASREPNLQQKMRVNDLLGKPEVSDTGLRENDRRLLINKT